MSRTTTRTVLAAAALVLGLTACGGDDRAQTLSPGPSDSAAAASTPPTAEDVEVDADGALTEDQLEKALPALSDVPTGYKISASTDESQEPSNTSAEGDCAKRFDALGSASDDADAQAEVNFEKGLGTVLSVALASYEDGDKLEESLDRLTNTLEECRAFTDTDETGDKTEFEIAGLSFPKYGDETFAFAVTGKTSEFEIALDVVIVRIDQTIALVSQGGLVAASVEDVEQTLTATLRKLDEVA